MKKIYAFVFGLALVFSYQCKDAKKEMKEGTEAAEEMMEAAKEEVMPKTITFSMEPKSNSNVRGEVTFTDKGGMVSMTANLSGLTPGEHAIHLHEKADCSADDGTSTGGHWNPTNEPHGKWGAPEGYHKGDIGNFTADAEGNATVEFETDQWCIGCDDENKNILGKGVIVHEGSDDYTSQPSGAAGSRVSCAGIIE
jgi:Cu-Zn family superoxide dismutase